jgi:hypothetical protein
MRRQKIKREFVLEDKFRQVEICMVCSFWSEVDLHPKNKNNNSKQNSNVPHCGPDPQFATDRCCSRAFFFPNIPRLGCDRHAPPVPRFHPMSSCLCIGERSDKGGSVRGGKIKRDSIGSENKPKSLSREKALCQVPNPWDHAFCFVCCIAFHVPDKPMVPVAQNCKK